MNDWLDRLPRTELGVRSLPAFRTCGVVGFYGAVVATLGGGLLAGLSPLVLAVLSLVCGLSFFVYAYARRAVTGRETLVLLEHVWFAEACCAVTLWTLGLPVLAYLDPVAVGLCVFLAAGRVGCLLVGCCHGRPSSFGIRYREGNLAGVRLFPVPAVEAGALLLIGLTGLLALPFARPGVVFTWFLLAYAVVRFGLEGVRGDRRPVLAGLTVNRWMCVAEAGLGLWLAERELGTGADPLTLGLLAALVAALAAALVALRLHDSRLLAPGHVAEVRQLVEELEDTAGTGGPAIGSTSRGVSVGVSRPDGDDGSRHISLSLPDRDPDLELLCELAARTLSEVESASVSGRGDILHLRAQIGVAPADPGAVADGLYGALARALQASSAPLRDGYFEAGRVA